MHSEVRVATVGVERLGCMPHWVLLVLLRVGVYEGIEPSSIGSPVVGVIAMHQVLAVSHHGLSLRLLVDLAVRPHVLLRRLILDRASHHFQI